MDDILVEIYCETMMREYDFWLPKKGYIKDVIKKLAEEIMIFENNSNLFDSQEIEGLVLVGTNGNVFNKDYTVVESGIMGGDRLMLV